MDSKEILYHGTCRLFKEFSLSHLGEGEGHSKFGHGIYITSSYKTAALYASKVAKACGEECCYVYTVEVPALTAENHIFSCKAVNPAVAQRVEQALGETIPDEAKELGKYFRKYVGNLLTGERKTLKQRISSASPAAEDAVAEFLKGVGVVFLAWPYSQTNPEGETNRAVLDEGNVKIVKIEQVEVDAKNKLIEGSQKEIKLQ